MRRKIFATYTGWLIAINVIAFIGFIVLANYVGDDRAVDLIAIQPVNIISGAFLWTIITSMFMHAGLSHLFVNMFSLMFVGSFTERLVGKKRFLWLYLGGGIFAGLFFVLIAFLTGSDLNVYAVGASGAIFALGGLLAVLTPRLPVLVFFIIPMPMWLAMIFLLGILWVLSFSLGLPIGNVAHLGGLLVGLGYGFYLRKKYPRKTAMISRYFAR